MKKEKVRQFIHLLAGFLILMHAFQAFEREDHNTAFVFMGVAILFLIVAGIHQWLERKFRKSDTFFFAVEAVALGCSAWQYKQEGLISMVTIVGVIAAFYVWVALYIFFLKSHRRHHRRHHRSSRRPSSDMSER